MRKQIGPEQKTLTKIHSIRDLFVEHGLRVVIETKFRSRPNGKRESIYMISVDAVHKDEISLAKRLYKCWLFSRKNQNESKAIPC